MHSSRGLSPTLIGVIVVLSAVRSAPRGVWERIHYDSAAQPTDVFFTTPDEGWLAVGGSVLHTTDGGMHWEVQLADSASKPRGALSEFRFIDGIHGWVIATRGGNAVLLRTIDGRQWQAIGTAMPTIADYGFLSDSIGIALSGTRILRTTNSGASWAVVSECLTTTVGGEQGVSCTPQRLHFISRDTGYIAAAMRGLATAPTEAVARWILLRTTDAGASWHPLGADYAGVPEALFFINSDTGYVRLADGFLYATRDAGSSWQQVAPSIAARLRFADPQVGWALAPTTLTYTINGGATWDTTASGLGGPVTALSLPRRDRAYAIVAGSLFRYRVTSTDSTLDVVATIRAMPAPESTSAAQVKKLAAQVLAQSNSATPKNRNVDSVLADIRLLAAQHRNLNLLVDGTDGARTVLDHVSEVQLRVRELRATSGGLARLAAFTRLTVAVDSLSNVTSLAIQRVPKFSIHLRKKRAVTAPNVVQSAAPAAPAPATPALSRTKVPSAKPAAGLASNPTQNAKGVKDTARLRGDTARAKSDSSGGGKDTTKSKVPSPPSTKPAVKKPNR